MKTISTKKSKKNKISTKRPIRKFAEGKVPLNPGEFIDDLADPLIDSAASSFSSEYDDNRENPAKAMKRNNSVGVASSIAKGTAKGAAMGSAIPVVGTLVGAGIGAVTSGVGQLIGSGKRKREVREAEQQWGQDWRGKIAAGRGNNAYKDGGPKVIETNESPMSALKTVVNKKLTPDPTKGIAPTKGTIVTKANVPAIVNPVTNPNLIIKSSINSRPTTSELEGMNSQYASLSPEERKAFARTFKTGYRPIKPNAEVTYPDGTKKVYSKKEMELKYPDVKVQYKKGGFTTGLPKLKEGGEIKGKGGPKEDKIKMKSEEGSFIVPTENADEAMNIGKEYLGWADGESASRKSPGSDIMVSNGEVIFTPDEVSKLRYYGINLDRLAPNANPRGSKKADEGLSDEYSDTGEEVKKKVATTAEEKKKEEEKLNGEKLPEEEPGFFEKLLSWAPDALPGMAQAGVGIMGLKSAGAMPDVDVSESLKALSADMRKQSEYGLEPGTKSAIESSIEKARRDGIIALRQKGGSAQERMQNIQGLTASTIDKKTGLAMADQDAIDKKRELLARIVSQVGSQEFDKKKVAQDNWKEVQAVNAGLLSAGIANIVGARKLKNEMDYLKRTKEEGKVALPGAK